MNRQQKEAVISQVKEELTSSPAAFLVGYKGLTVSHMQSLRASLREDDSVLKITKARLMKIAASGIEGIDEFASLFKDQIGLVFVKGEVPSVAKKLVDFSKKNETFKVVSCFFESKSLSEPEINFLASLPTKDVLLAQLMGVMQAPARNFAVILKMMIVRLVLVLGQISKKN